MEHKVLVASLTKVGKHGDLKTGAKTDRFTHLKSRERVQADKTIRCF